MFVATQARLGRSEAATQPWAVVTLLRLLFRVTFFSRLGSEVALEGNSFTMGRTEVAGSISSSESIRIFFLFVAAAPRSDGLSRVESCESITRILFTIGTNFCSGAGSWAGLGSEAREVRLADKSG
jgi:hypothetical protein